MLITSGNLVITVLWCSRKDGYDQVFADRSQAPRAACQGRLTRERQVALKLSGGRWCPSAGWRDELGGALRHVLFGGATLEDGGGDMRPG